MRWMEKQKHLNSFRRWKQDQGCDNFAQLYPHTKLLCGRPLMKFPKEETINKKLNEITEKLQLEEFQTIEYCGIAFVVLRTQRDTNKVLEYFKYNAYKRVLK